MTKVLPMKCGHSDGVHFQMGHKISHAIFCTLSPIHIMERKNSKMVEPHLERDWALEFTSLKRITYALT